MSNMSKNNRNVILYAPPVKIGKKYWFPYANALYSYDESSMKIVRERKLSIPMAQIYSYRYIANVENKIIMSPQQARDIIVYDLETDHMRVFDTGSDKPFSYYGHIVVFGDKAFILSESPNNNILVLDKLSHVRRINIVNWNGNVKKGESTSEYVIQGRYLWVTAHYSPQVLKLDMESEKYELIAIGKDSTGYTGIALDGECLWLAESNTGAFVKYDTRNGNTIKFTAPTELDYNSSEKSYVHTELFDFGTYIVSIPALCNKMIILDKETSRMDIFPIDFFDSIIGSKAKYKYGNYRTSCFGMKVDDKTLWVQRTLDGVIACINMKDSTYSVFTLELSEEEINDIYMEICRPENAAIIEGGPISLNSFIRFLRELGGDAKRQSDSHHGTDIWTVVK